MHEMGEMKRPQELRVDKFSIQKVRESHDTYRGSFHKYKNYKICLSDSGEFHEVGSIFL